MALIVAGCSSSGRLKVGLAYAVGGPGDHGFNDSALAGLNRAQSHLDGKISSVRALSARPNETEQDQFNRLSLLCKAGYDPVIAVGFTYAGADPSNGPLARAAKECPDTHFAIVDDDSVHAPNVANLVFADEQGSYLMGIVAATKATSNVIGFVGACPAPVIDRFLAGYQAGARSIKPDIAIKKAYLSSDPRKCDFTDVDAARTAAAGLYAEHADVVYQAAGGAGLGVFEAAKAAGKYAIGADEDQYQNIDPSLRPTVLTSMVKHVDVAVDDFITSVSGGLFKPGVHRYDLSDEGESYATSGNAISQLTPQLDAAEKKIISGAIVVPTAPTS
ncbi:MAG TPA: BMP family ABC transporter substrate-binding protein [Micromonosporaceae bacterium]